jgi:hypothetical protein
VLLHDYPSCREDVHRRRGTARTVGNVEPGVKKLWAVALTLLLSGCVAGPSNSGHDSGAAPLRGFGIDVDQAVADRVPTVHLKTCGTWGCQEQDVALSISGPTSAAPCGSPSGAPDGTACGLVQLPGPGPGYGYAPVPGLTVDPVTVTVTTPPGAPFAINSEVPVQPHVVCPNGATDAATCAGGAAQAQLRIAADGTVSQSR